MHTIGILGATGSIGTQALNLVETHSDRFRATVLTAHSDAQKLFELVRKYRPLAAGLVIEPDEIPADLRHCEWFFGEDCSALAIRACRPDDALAAVVGIAGLPAVMEALDVCGRVLLANKEALVTGGELVMNKSARKNVQLLPVDSEHSAIFQCLQGAGGNAVRKLMLTASGGPLRTWSKARIANATVQEALGHPTWRMGNKITIDCATMMNKGLELIEAHHLFAMPPERIEVLVHPQSAVHSMVEYEDGAVIAQLGVPDMRAAIGYAMGYPKRLAFGGERLDFVKFGNLTFEAPDEVRFPCLKMAREAIVIGGRMPVALNGANEAAVGAFLAGRIRFGQIAEVVDAVLQRFPAGAVADIADVYDADAKARALAEQVMQARM